MQDMGERKRENHFKDDSLSSPFLSKPYGSMKGKSHSLVPELAVLTDKVGRGRERALSNYNGGRKVVICK